jgi:DNA polymerase-3 subunit delta
MKVPPYQIESYIQKIADEKVAGCLLFGPEASLVNYRFNIIAKKITPDLADPFLVSNLSKERISEDRGLVVDEFFAMSMLGGRRLILVKDGDAKVAEGLQTLFDEQDFAKKSDNFILIQAGDLDKSSTLRKLAEANPYFAAIACYEDNEAVIKKFIVDEFSKRKIKFNAQISDLLISKFGVNRTLLLSEIEKIITFLGDNTELTVEMVEGLSDFEGESSINDFVNSFANRKFADALLAIEKNFRNGIDAVTMIRFLSNYLQKLYNARVEIDSNLTDFETAIKNQRLFFKAETQFRQNLNSLSLKFLIRNLRMLEKLEARVKSGELAPRLLLTGFVQSFLAKKKS